MKKHIVCFGDSNTHGLCGDVSDTESHSSRFTENERWTCLLQKALGDDYLVIEEGLSGRTTVFEDPVREGMKGLDSLYSCLMSHEPVDLLIIMLGTNDCKERFSANPACIATGLDRLIVKAKSIECWKDGKANILIISPAHVKEGFNSEPMGKCCIEKSTHLAKYFEEVAKTRNCAFLDAEGIAEVNETDFVHLSAKGHRNLAGRLSEIVPGLV